MSTKRSRRERAKNSAVGLLREITRRQQAERPQIERTPGPIVVSDEVLADLVASQADRQGLPLFAETVRRTGFAPAPAWASETMLLPLVQPAEVAA